LIAELQRDLAVYKKRAQQAEEDYRHSEQKAGNHFCFEAVIKLPFLVSTIEHLHQSLSQLKREATVLLVKKE
jgi:hypothetical protein